MHTAKHRQQTKGGSREAVISPTSLGLKAACSTVGFPEGARHTPSLPTPNVHRNRQIHRRQAHRHQKPALHAALRLCGMSAKVEEFLYRKNIWLVDVRSSEEL